MKLIKAIIADDEKYGRDSIELILTNFCPEIHIVAKTDSIHSTINAINDLNPDLVFLDIDFPDGNGFEVIYAFENPTFEVIFVTAYSGYAVKAIKCSALDYLLKPIEKDELVQAVNKAREKMNNPHTSGSQLKLLKEYSRTEKLKKLVIPNEDGFIFVDIDNIIRCEAESNYTRFYLINNSKILSSRTLKEYEEMLSDNNFYRIHKSHLINLNHIKKYLKGKGGSVIMSDNSEIEVSARKKLEFVQYLSRI